MGALKNDKARIRKRRFSFGPSITEEEKQAQMKLILEIQDFLENLKSCITLSSKSTPKDPDAALRHFVRKKILSLMKEIIRVQNQISWHVRALQVAFRNIKLHEELS